MISLPVVMFPLLVTRISYIQILETKVDFFPPLFLSSVTHETFHYPRYNPIYRLTH